jgi:inorganic pyrophosphatase
MRAKMEVSDLDSGQIDRYHEFRPHPWHGLVSGPNPPSVVQAYIEITTYDVVKYEIDKDTGYLCVDRPQRTSSQPPTLYGFIPRTYCGDKVGALYEKGMHGDGDPLEMCGKRTAD